MCALVYRSQLFIPSARVEVGSCLSPCPPEAHTSLFWVVSSEGFRTASVDADYWKQEPPPLLHKAPKPISEARLRVKLKGCADSALRLLRSPVDFPRGNACKGNLSPLMIQRGRNGLEARRRQEAAEAGKALVLGTMADSWRRLSTMLPHREKCHPARVLSLPILCQLLLKVTCQRAQEEGGEGGMLVGWFHCGLAGFCLSK